MAQSVQVKTVRDWHESLIDFIIANPGATLRIKAQVFGVSMSWLSIVENSDSFKEAMRLRRDEHFNNLSTGIVGKLEATADMLIEEINHRIQTDASSAIPFNSLRDTADMALKHLGFGAKGQGGVQQAGIINNNTVIVQDREALREAREMMAAKRAEATIEATKEVIEDFQTVNLEIQNSEFETEEKELEEFEILDAPQSTDLPE